MRLTLDPVRSSYRPLLFYAVTHLSVKCVTSLAMQYLGFDKHRSGSLQYWHRQASPGEGEGRTQQAPVVFCHGLGVGVLPYIDFLRKLLVAGVTQEVFCVELPHISMRIQPTVPSSSELVSNIGDMLAAWQAV